MVNSNCSFARHALLDENIRLMLSRRISWTVYLPKGGIHSLSRVEKMSNFALVLPPQLSEPPPCRAEAPSDCYLCLILPYLKLHGSPHPPHRRPLQPAFPRAFSPCAVIFPRRQAPQSLSHHVRHHARRSRPPVVHTRLLPPPYEHRLSSPPFLSRHCVLRPHVLPALRTPPLPAVVGQGSGHRPALPHVHRLARLHVLAALMRVADHDLFGSDLSPRWQRTAQRLPKTPLLFPETSLVLRKSSGLFLQSPQPLECFFVLLPRTPAPSPRRALFLGTSLRAVPEMLTPLHLSHAVKMWKSFSF